jgi:hypothetical protein
MENENLSTESNESCDQNKLSSLKLEKHETILKNYNTIILYWKILHIIFFLSNIPLIIHLYYLENNDINVKCTFYIVLCINVIIFNLISNIYCLIKLFQNKPIDATHKNSNLCLCYSFCLIFLSLILNKKLLGKGVYNYLNNKTNYQKIFEFLLMIVFAVLILTFKMKELYKDCKDNIPNKYSFLSEQENEDEKENINNNNENINNENKINEIIENNKNEI